MKSILFLLLLTVSNLGQAWVQRAPQDLNMCQVHAPYGFPQTTNVTTICRQAYLVGYDAASKIPKYVVYELLPQTAISCIARTNSFAADQSVQNGATPADYAGTKFDRGHLAPEGDMSWDVQVEFESFLMTNISPQAGSLNRGAWKLLETSVRGWAVQQNQSFTVMVGNIYGPNNATIGNGVVVPHALYKIVINNQTGQVAGWRFPHVAPYPILGNDLTKLRASVAQIESEAGVKFAFPAGATELQPGKEWPVDFGELTTAKRIQCGITRQSDK